MRRCVAFGRQAGSSLEHAMKMERAEAGDLGEFIERRHCFARFDLPTGHRHCRGVLAGDISLILACAFAWAVARRFGSFGAVEKFDILRLGQTRKAAGSAIDAGGFYRIDKLPVGSRIPREHGGPAWIGFNIDDRRKLFHGE